MKCRERCGACCIVPSISSALPKMPNGKKGGERCAHLTENYQCELFGSPERPDVCGGFKPEKIFCGEERKEAIQILAQLEDITDWSNL